MDETTKTAGAPAALLTGANLADIGEGFTLLTLYGMAADGDPKAAVCAVAVTKDMLGRLTGLLVGRHNELKQAESRIVAPS